MQVALESVSLSRLQMDGEEMEMSLEMQVENKSRFVAKLNTCMEKYNVPFERLYNADQTGLFYNKMPNRIYLDKDKVDVHGVKQMKSKDRVTPMVCTSVTGEKVPLLMVGTAKQPLCFIFLCPNGQALMVYTDQANAWFTKEVTIYWVILLQK
jgi:hypothetical protein